MSQAIWKIPNFATTTLGAGNSQYDVRVSYTDAANKLDGNGNIRSLVRHAPGKVNEYDYFYERSEQPNTLTRVGGYANYTYDAIGRIRTANYVEATRPGISVRYDVSGKVTEVRNFGGTQVQARYSYDDKGYRVKTDVGGKETYYVRDASGSILSVYVKEVNGTINPKEYPIYGSGRVGVAHQRVQGLDYVYTLQGWLKAMNAPTLNPADDPGGDGSNELPADAYGMMLTYYSGDYANTKKLTNRASYENTSAVTNLYNGNIAGWTDGYYDPMSSQQQTFNRSFTYDKLNRLVESRYQLRQADGTYATLADAYRTAYSYDGNGNLQTLDRYDQDGRRFDALRYNYQNGTNRLSHVDDEGQVLVSDEEGNVIALADGQTLDLDTLAYQDLQDQDNDNYVYDEIGNLVEDRQEKIKITWTVYGKVAQVSHYADEALTQLQRTITFGYDAGGNRISKAVAEHQGGSVTTLTTTYYVRDASGNPMAVYTQTDEGGQQQTKLSEQMLYGSDRLGQQLSDNLVVSQTRTIGNQSYTLETDERQQSYAGGWLAATSDGVQNTLEWLSPGQDGSLQGYLVASLGTSTVTATATAQGRLTSAYAITVSDTDEKQWLQLVDRSGSLMPGMAEYPLEVWSGSPLYMGEQAGSALWALAINSGGSLVRQDVDLGSGDVTQAAQVLLSNVRGMSLHQQADGSYRLYTLKTNGADQLQAQAWTLSAAGVLSSQTLWQSEVFAASTNLGVHHQISIGPDGKLLAVASSEGAALAPYTGVGESGATMRVFVIEGNAQPVFSASLSSEATRLDDLQWHPEGNKLAITRSTPENATSLHSLVPLELDENALTVGTAIDLAGTGELLATDDKLYVSSSSQSYELKNGSLNEVSWTNQLLAVNAPQHYSEPLISNGISQQYDRTYGLKKYELKDHLGNVRATVTDQLLWQDGSKLARVESYSHYYPFGWNMPGLGYNGGDYRFGFNGMEKDNEIAGSGSIYTAEYWQYDSRLGRRWNVDPVIKPYESSYATFTNNPIWFVDPSGADTTLYASGSGKKLDIKISDSEKTPIWIVNTQAENYDVDNPWATARPLSYEVGASSKHGGLTGKSFRHDHPLCGIGTCAGTQVYEEDLLDLTTEFQNVVVHGLPEFADVSTSFFPNIGFRNLVTDDAKYDLKSRITNDGTSSYAAAVIGEWSFFNGTLRRYDDYGNISYGAFGLKAGFPKGHLRFSSNLNQWWKDLFEDTSGSGDEPRDVQMINLGFKLYEQGYFNQK